MRVRKCSKIVSDSGYDGRSFSGLVLDCIDVSSLAPYLLKLAFENMFKYIDVILT